MADSLVSALYAIPPDDRETWVYCAMAVKHALGESGYDLWDGWSRQSRKYRKADANAVWRSVSAAGGITAAWLFAEARRNGWDGVRLDGSMKPQQVRRQADEHSAEQRKREDKARMAALAAEAMIAAATYGHHPYLDKKGFPNAMGLVYQSTLIVPMRHYKTNAVQSVQRISPKGRKLFLEGGKAGGAVFRLGRGSISWYCEGYATGLSIQAALKRLGRSDEVIVCFSAGNIPAVVNKTRAFVVADNDASGTGERYARKAGVPYWMPPEVGDANDFFLAHGVDALAKELRQKLIQ